MTSDAPLTYVLIPGAWHGGWAWRPVAERLRAAGRQAICLTLPGLGDGDDPAGHDLQDAVDHVVSEVERRKFANVTLVGHSWGGYPMTGAAHRLSDRVSKVIYYSAHVPVRGRSMIDDIPSRAAALMRGLIDASPTRAILPTPEFVQEMSFIQGAEESTMPADRASADTTARKLLPGRPRHPEHVGTRHTCPVPPRRGRSGASPARRRVRGTTRPGTHHGSWDARRHVDSSRRNRRSHSEWLSAQRPAGRRVGDVPARRTSWDGGGVQSRCVPGGFRRCHGRFGPKRAPGTSALTRAYRSLPTAPAPRARTCIGPSHLSRALKRQGASSMTPTAARPARRPCGRRRACPRVAPSPSSSFSRPARLCATDGLPRSRPRAAGRASPAGGGDVADRPRPHGRRHSGRERSCAWRALLADDQAHGQQPTTRTGPLTRITPPG